MKLCPYKFGYYEFEGGQECIGSECGMFKRCNADYEITAVEFDALDEHAQALERENAGLRKLCGANDTLSVENDVSAASVDANDGSELQTKVDELTTERDELYNDLEKAVSRTDKLIHRLEYDYGITASWGGLLNVWQIENNEHDLLEQVHAECTELQKKVDELTAELERETLIACNTCAARIDLEQQVDELTEDYKASSNGLEILTLKNAELQTQVNNLNSENAKLSSDELYLRQALASAEYDNATLREKLGRMLDMVQEMERVGTLVDQEGNVIG